MFLGQGVFNLLPGQFALLESPPEQFTFLTVKVRRVGVAELFFEVFVVANDDGRMRKAKKMNVQPPS